VWQKDWGAKYTFKKSVVKGIEGYFNNNIRFILLFIIMELIYIYINGIILY